MRMTRGEYEYNVLPFLPPDVYHEGVKFLSKHNGTHVYFDREMFIKIVRSEREGK